MTIRIDECTYVVYDVHGHPQLWNRFFPDTGSLEIDVVITMFMHEFLNPVVVFAKLTHENSGQSWVWTRATWYREGSTATLRFVLPRSYVLARAGKCTVLIGIDGASSDLRVIEYVAPVAKLMFDDLQVEKASMIALRKGGREECHDVCTAFDEVYFVAQFVSEAFPPLKYHSKSLQARLVHLSSGTHHPPIHVPLTAVSGRIEVKVPCSFICEKPGRWELTLEAQGRTLSQRTFSVLTPEELLAGIEAELVGMTYKSNSGKWFPLTGDIFAADTISLRAHVRLGSTFSSLLMTYPLVFRILHGQEVVHELGTCLTLENGECTVSSGEIPVPEMAADADAREWKMTVSLCDRLLVRKLITVRPAIPASAKRQLLIIGENWPMELDGPAEKTPAGKKSARKRATRRKTTTTLK